MITPKRLLELGRTWKKAATLGRRRLSSKTSSNGDVSEGGNAPLASKGHFVVYTVDERRFELPLTYLKSGVVRELFRTSEEEFGFHGGRRITLPCDAVFMESTIAFLQSRSSKSIESAMQKSVVPDKCSASSLVSRGPMNQHAIVRGF